MYYMYLADPSQVRYAILSHVWRESEQSFQDIQQLRTQYGSEGNPRDHTLVKIRRCCVYAEEHGSKWVWVDTCCIDKSSSAELSEAINSMYIWYTRAAVCYVFLDDVGDDEDPHSSCYARPIPTDTAFSRSKWFTRGWTLQELIAPASLMFLSRDWRTLGTKYDLADLLEAITGIDAPVLRHETQLASISIARRMSWAARRQTTRAEDCAYSLMGLFGIHMPTIYGEGTKAFIRLQQEIIRHSPDHSIFAW
ncbi:heterokaryon incompatibility protein-domain-containing protein, partial [Cerioporus squamosus]